MSLTPSPRWPNVAVKQAVCTLTKKKKPELPKDHTSPANSNWTPTFPQEIQYSAGSALTLLSAALSLLEGSPLGQHLKVY